MPVELVDFDGRHLNKVNQLFWNTAAEINNAGFEVQRQQTDRDREFSTIGWVEAKSPNGATYQFEDENISLGAQYYYRLKQIDLDGNFAYSPIITLKVPGTHPGLILYPNPVHNQLSLELFLPDLNVNEPVNFSILNLTGQEIKQVVFNPDMPFSTQQVNLEDLSAGVYVALVKQGTTSLPVRFVKW